MKSLDSEKIIKKVFEEIDREKEEMVSIARCQQALHSRVEDSTTCLSARKPAMMNATGRKAHKR